MLLFVYKQLILNHIIRHTFFKALFNQNKNDYGALNKYIIDAKQFGVEVLPPHINKSANDFIVDDDKILFGLGEGRLKVLVKNL